MEPMIADGDLSDLATIVHPDAVFRSPMAIIPYASRDAFVLTLTTVIDVFQPVREDYRSRYDDEA